MNDKYLTLGRAIAAQSPPGFLESKLVAVIDGDRADLRISAIMPDTIDLQLGLDEDRSRDIRAALLDLRDAMAEADGKAWRTCTVTLKQGGGFALDVGD